MNVTSRPTTPCPNLKRPKSSEKLSILSDISIESIILARIFMFVLGITIIKITDCQELCNLYNISYYGWAPSTIEKIDFTNILQALIQLKYVTLKFNKYLVWNLHNI